MKQIKIKKEFWDKIVSGEKQYEFRKLSKGLESGTYRFVSVEHKKPNLKENGYSCSKCGQHKDNCVCGNIIPKEIFGTAKLTALHFNPAMWMSRYAIPTMQILDDDEDHNFHKGSYDYEIDRASYEFVFENYRSKNIEFIVYEISEVNNAI